MEARPCTTIFFRILMLELHFLMGIATPVEFDVPCLKIISPPVK